MHVVTLYINGALDLFLKEQDSCGKIAKELTRQDYYVLKEKGQIY